MIIRRILGVAAVLATAACAEPSAPLMTEATHAIALATGHRAVGSGHVQQPAGMREFTFHAIEHPAGGASGSFKVVLANGLFFEADVTCLAVEGNIGWIGGVIRSTNAGVVVVGSSSTLYVIDGGEGADAAPDIVSTATFNGAAGADLAFCADRPLALAPFTVTNGNVQVW